MSLLPRDRPGIVGVDGVGLKQKTPQPGRDGRDLEGANLLMLLL
jgi:hypothetical protein